MLTCENESCDRQGDGYCTDENVLACYNRMKPAEAFHDMVHERMRSESRFPASKTPFDYKNGEDFICVLCGKTFHTEGPRPDKLCDPCWELKARIECQPDLARKVILDLEIKELSE